MKNENTKVLGFDKHLQDEWDKILLENDLPMSSGLEETFNLGQMLDNNGNHTGFSIVKFSGKDESKKRTKRDERKKSKKKRFNKNA